MFCLSPETYREDLRVSLKDTSWLLMDRLAVVRDWTSRHLTLCQGFHRPWTYIFMVLDYAMEEKLSFEYFQKLPVKRVWILYWAETQVLYWDYKRFPIPNSKAGHTLYDVSLFLTQFLSCTTHFRVRPKFSFIMRSNRGPTNCFRLAVGRSDKSLSAVVRLSRSAPFLQLHLHERRWQSVWECEWKI